MRSLTIIEILPFHSHSVEVKRFVGKVYYIPKFSFVSLLSTLNFPIKMRCARFYRTELYEMLMQLTLEIVIEELGSPVSLYTLYREGEISNHLVKEQYGAGCFLVRIHADYFQSCAVINGCELICSVSELRHIHLNPLAGYFFVVADVIGLSAPPYHRLDLVSAQHAPYSHCRNARVVA